MALRSETLDIVSSSIVRTMRNRRTEKKRERGRKREKNPEKGRKISISVCEKALEFNGKSTGGRLKNLRDSGPSEKYGTRNSNL